MNTSLRRAMYALCVGALACIVIPSGPLLAQSNWQQQQQRQQDMQRQQQEQQRQQMQAQQRQQMQEQQRQQMQAQQRQQMQQQQQTQQRQQMQTQQQNQQRQTQQQQQMQQRQQQTAEQQRRQMQQQGKLGTIQGGKPTGMVISGGMPRMARPLTAGEIQRGFTGHVTNDGRALIKFQGRIFTVPASRVSGLSAKLATQRQQQQATRWTALQRAGASARIQALTAQRVASRGTQGGGAAGGRDFTASNDNSKAANRIAYTGFIKQSGRDQNDLFPHSRGWDFSKPTRVRTIKAGTELCQWQVPGTAGSYYAACGTSTSKLGIAEQGTNSSGEIIQRIEKRYLVKQDIEVLEGTAASVVDDWSIKGQRIQTAGGASQYLVKRGDSKFLEEK